VTLTSRLGLLREHNFRQLWSADLISQLGTRTALLAMPLLAVVTLHATTFETALLTAAGTAGSLLFGLPAGAWLDRMRIRPVLIATDLARTALLLAIPIAALFGLIGMPLLYVIAFAASVCTVFFNIGQMTYVARLLPSDQLVEANTKLASNASVAAVAGSGAGGWVVQVLTAPIAIAVDAVSYLLSAIGLARIRTVEPPVEPAPRHLLREIGEGIRFVGGHPVLRALGLNLGIFVLFQGADNGIMIVFLVREVHLNAATIGLLGTVGLFGALLASGVTGRITARIGEARTILLAGFAAAAAFLCYPLTAPGWAVLWFVVAGFLAAFAIVASNIVQTSYRQRLSPPHLQGRSGSIMTMLTWGMLPAGSIIGGVVASVVDLRTALLVNGVGVALSVVPLLLSPLRSAPTKAQVDHDSFAG
jgi:MFS family permease